MLARKKLNMVYGKITENPEYLTHSLHNSQEMNEWINNESKKVLPKFP